MGILMIILALLPLLLQIIQWLSNRTQPLTPKQLKKLNHVVAKCHELTALAVKHGADPKGIIDPDEE